jgi:hypothetical protein
MKYLIYALTTISFLLGLINAQVGVGVEIPEGTTITLSSERVVFDLGVQGFPPPEFPYFYEPTAPTEPVTLRLFSNISGNWQLEVSMSGGFTGAGGRVIPVTQLEYRLNGGSWLPMASRVALVSGSGASSAYETHTLELRLKLVGNEAPGSYEGVLNFTFVQL